MTEKMILDAEGALRTLRLVVFEKGADYVYPEALRISDMGCRNFFNEAPSCIVGHALNMLGLSYEAAVAAKVTDGMGIYSTAARLDGFSDFEWEITNEAMTVFATAQSHQDNGHSWGDALAASERVFKDLVEAAGRYKVYPLEPALN